MAEFDAAAFKAGTRAQWNAVAERWDGWHGVVEDWIGPANLRMLDMAEIGPGQRVLHVAAGSGREALRTAERVGPSGHVLVTDFSEELIAIARRNIAAAGLGNVAAAVMDGEAVEVPPGSFDAALSRLGLIFFPDQVGALKRQIAALKPGGRIGAVVYAEAKDCRFFADPVGIIRHRAALPPPQPGQPGPFSLGAPGRIEAVFADAGLEQVRTARLPAPLVMESAAECLRFQQESFGALHQMLAALDPAAREDTWAEVADALRAFETGGRFIGPCTLLVAVGRKPG
ncbi:methyltransferase domain-containing protein [Paralimibaculum aggregatum]|uniref:Methyltransferase domain-containing protein n=1 Tax=Paralimibaculum aggregatum TaxID=3036245 RepID=A0ABQ6LM27_9RHOB|nr:methyltransferase domain-containing protein [Limibaculum sp. NKW23]GMG84256.1 methyltransferase domain-containing protein [Limibaculum sp. NKW23]